MKHFFSAIMIFISISFVFILTTQTTNASFGLSKILPKKSFGGRILLAPMPATCIGTGMLVSLVPIGLGSVMPIYTTNILKIPTTKGQILGTATIDMTTCSINGVFFPVLKTTSNYGVSF